MGCKLHRNCPSDKSWVGLVWPDQPCWERFVAVMCRVSLGPLDVIPVCSITAFRLEGYNWATCCHLSAVRPGRAVLLLREAESRHANVAFRQRQRNRHDCACFEWKSGLLHVESKRCLRHVIRATARPKRRTFRYAVLC